MTRDEAKNFLETCIPGVTDPADPRLHEALKVAEGDPELAAWAVLWREHQGFDRVMADHVQAISVPRDLRARLAAAPKVVPLRFWRYDLVPYLQRIQPRWVAEACVLLLLGVIGMSATRDPVTFDTYREEALQAALNANPRFEPAVTNAAVAKTWLSHQGFAPESLLPHGLTNTQVTGCRWVDWRGHPVLVLRLVNPDGIFDMLVAEDLLVGNLPWEDRPNFEEIKGWKTTAWRRGSRAFVLSGMNYPAFTQKVYSKSEGWKLSPKAGAKEGNFGGAIQAAAPKLQSLPKGCVLSRWPGSSDGQPRAETPI